MGRTTVYNKLTTQEDIDNILEANKNLVLDFLGYLESVDRSPKTIIQYKSDLNIFFVWNLKFNGNKFFADIKKRELVRWQTYCLNQLQWSPKRLRRVKSAVSSLSNYIENIVMDDGDEEEEFKNFKPIVRKIESPENIAIRDKTIFNDEEVQHLLDVLVEQKEYEKACAIAISAYSGMRRSELLQMKISFFTDDKLINNGSMYRTEKIRSKGRGKNGKPISKYILVGAKKYIDMWLDERNKLGITNEELFVARHDNVWTARKTFDNWYPRLSEIVGKPFYLHSLRHFLNTKLVESNIPVEVIRTFFEWSDAQMVSYYCDSDMTEEFDKYFTSEGIVTQDEQKL